MHRLRCIRLLLCLLLAGTGAVYATGLELRGLSLTGPGRIRVEVVQRHAWNLSTAPANHDAVWIFGKYQTAGSGWLPLKMSTNAAAHSLDAPLLHSILPAPGGQGLLLRTDAPGAHALLQNAVEIALDSPLPAGNVRIQLYGVEMCRVEAGAFYAGDSSSHNSLHSPDGSGPVYLSGESGVVLGEGAQTLTLPDAWPKGTGGFYSMKYEITQAQYADFLNTLTYVQQSSRSEALPEAPAGSPAFLQGTYYRNGIRIRVPGNSSGLPAQYGCDAEADGDYGDVADGADRACNYLNWLDLCAWLDWAGLRPMTELEYEKACRGPLMPVPGEFAWGTDSVMDANTVQMDGWAAETVAETATATAGLASHGYAGPQGPLRNGFGSSSSSGRLQAGAGYWGIFELSGNLWEYVVSLAPGGQGFTNEAGDGLLSTGGEADAATWPDNTGAGYRGGGWNSGIVPGFRDLAVSDRFYITLNPEFRRNTGGGRGVIGL